MWDIALEKRLEDEKFLEQYGYKVYSQNDEDGILHEIFRRIGTEDMNFVEFGVDKGIESNSHALLLQGWRGLWIEGREEAYRQILRRFAPVVESGQLAVWNMYVSRENINGILHKRGCEWGLDLLSIDVDGNDWHIWNAIGQDIAPRVVVIEYNGKFTPEIDWKMAYNPDHEWDRSDRQGASLKALEKLGKEKGYQLVGTNICGINAFFVRKDLAGDKFPDPATAENLYNPARMNMLRHNNGHPAKNYVGNEVDGMEGVFCYYPDWNWLAMAGFYPFEVTNGIRKSIMREKKGRLFIRCLPADTITIRLHYELSVDPKCLDGGKLSGKAKIGDADWHAFEINEHKGFIDIPFESTDANNEIIAMDIEINQLWMPDEVIHNGDHRKQGLVVWDVEYLYK